MRNDRNYENDKIILKKARRRRRKIRRICVTVILVILALLIPALIQRVRTLKAFRCDYVRRIDLTDKIVSNIAVWLKDVEGADIEAGWIAAKTEGIFAQADLEFVPDGLVKGSYRETLSEESYEECRTEAYRLTGECLRELIIKRLTAVGYADTLSSEEADALIFEALGMPLEDYIKNAGVNVIPDYDELADGINRSGGYRIRWNTIEWAREGKELKDDFSVTSDSLAIPAAGSVYLRAGDDADKSDDADDADEADETDDVAK